MNDGVAFVVECDRSRIDRRLEHRYLDACADAREHGLELAVRARAERRPQTVGVLGNAADAFSGRLALGARNDVVTDPSPDHDPRSYVAAGVPFEERREMAAADPEGYTARARESMALHVEAMVGFQDAGAEVFDYGNSLRDEARQGGFSRAFAFPG